MLYGSGSDGASGGGGGLPEGPLGPPAKGLARHKRFTIEVVNSLID